jgi:hypothetical protein
LDKKISGGKISQQPKLEREKYLAPDFVTDKK